MTALEKPPVLSLCLSPLLSHWTLLTLLVPRHVGLFPHHAVQVFNNVTQCWHCSPGDDVRSHRLSAQFHKTPPTQMPLTSRSLPTTSVWLNYKVPMTFPLCIWLFAKTQRNTYIFQFISIKGNAKGHTWTARWRHRVRSGRIAHTGSSVPIELGCTPSWYVDVFSELEGLWTLVHLGFLHR